MSVVQSVYEDATTVVRVNDHDSNMDLGSVFIENQCLAHYFFSSGLVM